MRKEKFIFVIFLAFFIFLFFVNTGYSPLTISSTNYKIFVPTVYSGGLNTTSTNYLLTSTVAQAAIGNASSANYVVWLGRFQTLVVPTLILNVTISPIEAWWNEPTNASGTVTALDSSPINGSVVNITVADRTCYGRSDVTGQWSCNFSAPSSLGDYTLTATAEDPAGFPIRATNSFSVALNYGPQPVGSTDRSVYETPILIQEPSGSITKAIIRVLVWRG